MDGVLKEMVEWRHPWEAIPPFNERILFRITSPEASGTYYGYFDHDDRKFHIYNNLWSWPYDEVWAWTTVPDFNKIDVYNTTEDIKDFANRTLKKG